MKQLIEDYKRRLASAQEMLDNTKDTGSIDNVKKIQRLKTFTGEYRAVITDLEKAQRRAEDLENEEDNRIALLCRLYYRHKKRSDDEIREYLKTIKVVKMEKQAGGTVTKYYPLNAESMKKIKAEPRQVSLTFDAEKITPRAIAGLEVYKTVTYLCKSTSRFFLKPDIGEIFDAIDFHDLFGNKIDAICFLNGYETLPNTDGEHHIMTALLLTNVKARQKKEKQKAIQELHNL